MAHPVSKPQTPENPASIQTLADLRPGESAVIVELQSQGLERRRLMDLGMMPGTVITAEFQSPMNDPVAYRVRGALVALRHSQASQIRVRSIASEDSS